MRGVSGAAVVPLRVEAARRRPQRPARWHDRAVREPAAPFASTNRWLRGRILDRLRAAPDGEWIALDAAIGTHDPARVRAAADAMAADGVLELRGDPDHDGRLHARLPLA